MQTTYGARLRKAREHAQLSQAELARRIGIKAQAVQYLEDDEKAALGSKHTSALAQACGVNPIWLATGAAAMLGEGARAERIPSARELAKEIAALRPELRQALGVLVDALGEPQRRRIPLEPQDRQIPDSIHLVRNRKSA